MEAVSKGYYSLSTTKTNGTWSKGLTWQFNYNAEYKNDNSFDITVEVNGQRHYYYVTVVSGKPDFSTLVSAPATATAIPTTSKVIVNGKEVRLDAYNINNSNYFKLRDIASVLKGTEKQFNVTWTDNVGTIDFDENGNMKVTAGGIKLISNTSYVPVGGELSLGGGKTREVKLNKSPILKDGKDVYLAAYNINDNNYFKLRDLGQLFDFDVTWDAANNAILIDTTQGYTED